MLLGLGGASAAALAGCSTEAPSTGTAGGQQATDQGSTSQQTPQQTSVGTASGQAVEPTFNVKYVTVNPHTVDMPPLGDIDTWNVLVKVQLMTYGRNATDPNKEYQPLVVANNEFVDNRTWRITVADGFKWHNGKPVTAEDRYWKMMYYQHAARAQGTKPPWKEVRLSDDKMTLELDTHERQPKNLFLQTYKPFVRNARWRWKEWAEKMADATTSKEVSKIEENFSNTKHLLKDWVGNGVFKLASISDNQVTFEKWDEHPNADQQNIEKVVVPVANESQRRLLVKNDETDWTGPLPEGAGQLRTDGFEKFEKPNVGGAIFIFNWTRKHMARRPVRRALAYLTNTEAVMSSVGNNYPVKRFTGQSELQAKQWIDDFDTVKENYIPYGPGAKPEKAAEVLKNAGYSKNGDGKWVDEDGDVLSIKVRSVSWWKKQHRSYADQWRRGGFDVKLTFPSDIGQYHDSPEADWDITTWFHGRGVNHPNSTYGSGFFALPIVNEQDDGSTTQYGGRPRNVTVPTTIGDTEVTGSGQDLDLYAMQQELTNPDTSKERLKELDKSFSWWWNYDVPSIMWRTEKQTWNGDTANFVFPQNIYDDGKPDGWKLRDVSYGVNTGKLHGKTE